MKSMCETDWVNTIHIKIVLNISALCKDLESNEKKWHGLCDKDGVTCHVECNKMTSSARKVGLATMFEYLLTNFTGYDEFFYISIIMLAFSTIAAVLLYHRKKLIPPEDERNKESEAQLTGTSAENRHGPWLHRDSQVSVGNDMKNLDCYNNNTKINPLLHCEKEKYNGKKSRARKKHTVLNSLIRTVPNEYKTRTINREVCRINNQKKNPMCICPDETRSVSPTASLLDLMTDYPFESTSHEDSPSICVSKSILSEPLPVVIEGDESSIEAECCKTLNFKLLEECSIATSNELNMNNEFKNRTNISAYGKEENFKTCTNKETIIPPTIEEEKGTTNGFFFSAMASSNDDVLKESLFQNNSIIFLNNNVNKTDENIDPENQEEYKKEENEIKDYIQQKHKQLMKHKNEISLTEKDKKFDSGFQTDKDCVEKRNTLEFLTGEEKNADKYIRKEKNEEKELDIKRNTERDKDILAVGKKYEKKNKLEDKEELFGQNEKEIVVNKNIECEEIVEENPEQDQSLAQEYKFNIINFSPQQHSSIKDISIPSAKKEQNTSIKRNVNSIKNSFTEPSSSITIIKDELVSNQDIVNEKYSNNYASLELGLNPGIIDNEVSLNVHNNNLPNHKEIRYKEIVRKQENIDLDKTCLEDSSVNELKGRSYNITNKNIAANVESLQKEIGLKTQSNGTEIYLDEKTHTVAKFASLCKTTKHELNKNRSTKVFKSLWKQDKDREKLTPSGENTEFIKYRESTRCNIINEDFSPVTEDLHRVSFRDIDYNTVSNLNDNKLDLQTKRILYKKTQGDISNMGQLLSLILETDNFGDLPVEAVDMLGGKITISEDGEYAVIDIEGQRKEYKIDKFKLQNNQGFSEKIRKSRNLAALFDELEKINVVGENISSESVIDEDKKLLDLIIPHKGCQSEAIEKPLASNCDNMTYSGATKARPDQENMNTHEKETKDNEVINTKTNELYKSQYKPTTPTQSPDTLGKQNYTIENGENENMKLQTDPTNQFSNPQNSIVVEHNNEIQLYINEPDVFTVNKHNRTHVPVHDILTVNENKSYDSNENNARSINNRSANHEDYKINQNLVSNEIENRQWIKKTDHVNPSVCINEEKIIESKIETLHEENERYLDEFQSGKQTSSLDNVSIQLTDDISRVITSDVLEQHKDNFKSQFTREVDVNQENLCISYNQVISPSTKQNLHSNSPQSIPSHENSPSCELSINHCKKARSEKSNKADGESLNETSSSDNKNISLTSNRIHVVKELTSQRKSRSLSNLHIKEMKNQQEEKGQKSSNKFDKKRKSKSMEIRRKKPSVVLSASFTNISPKIKETNLDDLMNSVNGNGSHSCDYIFSTQDRRKSEPIVNNLSNSSDYYSVNFLSEETDIDDVTETEIAAPLEKEKTTSEEVKTIKQKEKLYSQKQFLSRELTDHDHLEQRSELESPLISPTSVCSEDNLFFSKSENQKELNDATNREDEQKFLKNDNGEHSQETPTDIVSKQTDMVCELPIICGDLYNVMGDERVKSIEFNAPDVDKMAEDVPKINLSFSEKRARDKNNERDTEVSVPSTSTDNSNCQVPPVVSTSSGMPLSTSDIPSNELATSLAKKLEQLKCMSEKSVPKNPSGGKTEERTLPIHLEKRQGCESDEINDGIQAQNDKSIENLEETVERLETTEWQSVNNFLSKDPLDSSISTVDSSSDQETNRHLDLTNVSLFSEVDNETHSKLFQCAHNIQIIIEDEDEIKHTRRNKNEGLETTIPFAQPLAILDKTESDIKDAVLSENIPVNPQQTSAVSVANDFFYEESLFGFGSDILTSSPRIESNISASTMSASEATAPILDSLSLPKEILTNGEDLSSSDTSYSFIDTDILPVTETVKTAAISCIVTPRDSEIKSAPNTPFTKKRNKNHLHKLLTKSNSWQFVSDYHLSKDSQHLIDSIEVDIENEFNKRQEDDQIRPDKNRQGDPFAKNNLKRVATRQLYGDPPVSNNSQLFQSISSTIQSRDTEPTSFKRSSSESFTLPKGLHLKPYASDQRISRSLHSIFTGDDLETDIDEVDETELQNILQSPALYERSPDVQVTDVDKMLSSAPPKRLVNARKYVIVSKTERRLSEKSLNSPTSPKELKLDNEKQENIDSVYQDVEKVLKNDVEEVLCNSYSSVNTVEDDSTKSSDGDPITKEIMEEADKVIQNQQKEIINGKQCATILKEDIPKSNKNIVIEERTAEVMENVTDDRPSDEDFTGALTDTEDSILSKQTFTERIDLLKFKDTIHTADYENFKQISRNPYNHRDSWDILEKSPIQEITKQSLCVDKGCLKKDTIMERQVKHQSWNILDLKTDDNMNFLIAPKINHTDKRHSSDISYLFQKYQKEKESVKRMNNNNIGDSLSDFSEISSISDASSFEDLWHKSVSEIEEPAFHFIRSMQTHQSAFSPLEYLSDDEIERLRKFQYDTESASKVNSPRLHNISSQSSGVVSPITPSSPCMSHVTAPIEVKETIVEDLPFPTKPTFVPEFSMFDESDLGNMVLAQAASAVRNRRKGSRRNVRGERKPVVTPCELNIGKNKRKETKASDSGISDSSNNLTPGETKLSSFMPVKPPSCELTEVKQMTEALCTENTNEVVMLSKQNVERHEAYGYDCSSSPQPLSSRSRKSSTSTLQSKHSTESDKKRRHVNGNLTGNKINRNSHEHSSSMPNLNFVKRLSSEDLEIYDTDDFLSESSLLSETFFEQGSIVDDELYIYPSLHLRTSRNSTPKCHEDNSDSSGGESFSTEYHDNYSDLKLKESERTVYCGNPPCSKQQVMVGHGRSLFTSCPACFTCYCSRSCRRAHWQDHKRICFYGRISYYIRSLITRCEKEPKLNTQLHSLAAESFNIFGRGVLFINFDSATDAKIALVSKTTALTTSPVYTPEGNIQNDNAQNRHTRFLYQTLQDYDPEQEFVINISIVIGDSKEIPKKNRKSTVVRCARIPILPANTSTFGYNLSSYVIRTFSLPKTIGEDFISNMEARRYYCREISFGLKRCGVHLKTEYPDAYEKLCRYVEQGVIFLPLVLYGQRDGRNFKCILYPESVNKSEEAHGEGVLV